jgi:hypothetical protein
MAEARGKSAGWGGAVNYSTDFPSIKDQVSPEEWQARIELAACCGVVGA